MMVGRIKGATREQPAGTAALLPRSVADANFIHVVRMFPLMRMWAQALMVGAVIEFNDRNMVQMPVEIAEALIRERAGAGDDLAAGCREVIAAIDSGGLDGLTRLYSAKEFPA